MGCNTSTPLSGNTAKKLHAEVFGLRQTSDETLEEQFHQKYILTQKLGQGSFAQVYLAEAVVDGNAVAVKIMDMRAANGNQKYDVVDDWMKANVKNEVAVWRRVGTQPHCVAFHAEYIEGPLAYIIMEKCDITLLQALENAFVFTERNLAHIIKEMLQALATIHALEVVHRDIKPDNFLCCGEERTIKLCDFGLSRILPPRGKLKGVSGTAPFMSPEMLLGLCYDTATDIWSLGVLAYVLLCGRFPYHPQPLSNKAMKEAIVAGTPGPTFQYSRDMDGLQPSPASLAFLCSMLDRNKGLRLSAAGALQLDWVALPADHPRSDQSLRPMLDAAKSVGAFETRAPKDLKQSSLDKMLAGLQAKHQGAPGRKSNRLMWAVPRLPRAPRRVNL